MIKVFNGMILKINVFLISGATGLIGATLVNSILVANQKYDINCQLYLLVRNIKKDRIIIW